VDYKKLLNKLDTSLTSSEYHGMVGSYSSSQLKTMLEDPELFYRKYITKEIPKEESSAFDVGTYFHTAVLEPHKLEEECAVYSGGIRSGSKWDEFKESNKGKAIITAKEKVVAEKIIQAVKDSPVSTSFLKTSKPEVSAFVELIVLGNEVFHIRGEDCWALVTDGWAKTSLDFEIEDILEFGVKIIVKTRADALDLERGIISDLKSTQGNTKKSFEMQSKVASYQYDFSAALYLDVFTLASGTEFNTFIWIFASKDFGNAKAYKATDKNIMVGRAKWRKAICELAKYLSNNWTFSDELGELDPTFYNLEWLK
jgi:hypothetical protein